MNILKLVCLIIWFGISLSACAEPNDKPIAKWWGTGNHQPKSTHQDSYLLKKTVSLSQCLGLDNQGRYKYQLVNQTTNHQLYNPQKWGLMLHSGHIKSARQKYYSDFDNMQMGNQVRIQRRKGFYASIVPYKQIDRINYYF